MLTLAVNEMQDLVLLRHRAREILQHLGSVPVSQSRFATAVIEVARESLFRGHQLEVCFELIAEPGQALLVAELHEQPSAPARETLRQPMTLGSAEGQPQPVSGMDAARRLVDRCDVTEPDGLRQVRLMRQLSPQFQADAALVRRVAGELAEQAQPSDMEELQRQNAELAQALSELRARQEELDALTQELEDTNRGVLALYAELEEKARHLRHVDQMKTRFLSNTSHELRTPLSSIRTLAKLLLDRVDGDLTPEQHKQVGFIEKAATDLSDLVNDLLDLAKIEAGKVEVTPVEFSLHELFSTLRGMMRPLCTRDTVQLVLEEEGCDLTLYADEGKVSQILRNLISNALKFTEEGEVRVFARVDTTAQRVTITVSDTGIGICQDDIDRIFEEFSQVENALQHRTKGTGLGLPLCRQLAALLGGELDLVSEPGQGSRFSLVLPLRYGQSLARDNLELA